MSQLQHYNITTKSRKLAIQWGEVEILTNQIKTSQQKSYHRPLTKSNIKRGQNTRQNTENGS